MNTVSDIENAITTYVKYLNPGIIKVKADCDPKAALLINTIDEILNIIKDIKVCTDDQDMDRLTYYLSRRFEVFRRYTLFFPR